MNQLFTHPHSSGNSILYPDGIYTSLVMNDWRLLVIKIHEVGIAIPTFEIRGACSVSLLGEVPTASFCRGTGGCGWVVERALGQVSSELKWLVPEDSGRTPASLLGGSFLLSISSPSPSLS